MTDQEIFEYLFEIAKTSKDQEGEVAACLVKDGRIFAGSPSADDSICHAEDLVIQKAQKQGIILDEDVVLYTTLEPCSTRDENVADCTSIILKADIKTIVYAAQDPEYSQEAKQRLEKAGVKYLQVKNSAIIRQAIDLFNSTSNKPFLDWQLPRQKKL